MPLSLYCVLHTNFALQHHCRLLTGSFLRGSTTQPIIALYREFPHQRPRPRFDAESTSEAMPPAALGKDSRLCHRTLHQCEILGGKRHIERDASVIHQRHLRFPVHLPIQHSHLSLHPYFHPSPLQGHLRAQRAKEKETPFKECHGHSLYLILLLYNVSLWGICDIFRNDITFPRRVSPLTLLNQTSTPQQQYVRKHFFFFFLRSHPI